MENAASESATPRRTQRERRELSYRRMIGAAIELFRRQGSSRTTLAQVGEMSGYSYGLVSHRFGSKEALVRAVTQHLQADFAKNALPALESLSGLSALIALAEAYLRAGAASDTNAMYALIGEALGPVPEIRPDIAEADRKFRLEVERRIEQGIRTREIRGDVDPKAYAAIFVGMLRGLVIQRLIEPTAFDLDAACTQLKRSIEHSLTKSS